MVHIFGFPGEFLDDPVKRVLSGFGDVKSIRRQKYIGRSDIQTDAMCRGISRQTAPIGTSVGGAENLGILPDPALMHSGDVT